MRSMTQNNPEPIKDSPPNDNNVYFVPFSNLEHLPGGL